MAGLVWAPRIVPQGGGTAVLLPQLKLLPDETAGLKQASADPGGVDGDLAGGEAQEPIDVTLEFEIEGGTPATQEETARALYEAFTAAATAHRFTLYGYWNANAGTPFGIGYDQCRLLPGGWRLQRKSYIGHNDGTTSTYHPAPWPVEVRLRAQSRINWTADMIAKIENGETTAPTASAAASASFGSITLNGGSLRIRNSDGTVTGFKASPSGALQTIVGLEVVDIITTTS